MLAARCRKQAERLGMAQILGDLDRLTQATPGHHRAVLLATTGQNH